MNIQRPLKFGTIVSARMGSSRLPGKAMKPIMNKPMVLLLFERLEPSKYSTQPILATTDKAEDDVLCKLLKNNHFSVYRGSEKDVAARLIGAALEFGLEYVARITADCPFVSAELIDYCYECASSHGAFDLATTKGQFPVGLDCEIFKTDTLYRLHQEQTLNEEDKEHVTLHFYRHSEAFKIINIPCPEYWQSLQHYTIDTKEDYVLALKRVQGFTKKTFLIQEIIQAEEHENLF